MSSQGAKPVRSPRRPAWVGCLFSSWLFAGCSGAAGEERVDSREQPIVGGQASPSPADDAVVLLRTEALGSETICTATHLAPNLVITARHCLAHTNPAPFLCSPTGQAIQNPDGAGILTNNVAAETLEIYTGSPPSASPVAYGKQVMSTFTGSVCIDDLAFVVLDRDLEGPLVPLRLRSSTAPGEAVTLIGYGLDETLNPNWRARPRRKRSGLLITSVGPDQAGADALAGRPRTLVLRGPSGCFGDSGGPALSSGGEVVGVYGLMWSSSEDCTSESSLQFFTHVAPFRELARDAFAAAGALAFYPSATSDAASRTDDDANRTDDDASRTDDAAEEVIGMAPAPVVDAASAPEPAPPASADPHSIRVTSAGCQLVSYAAAGHAPWMMIAWAGTSLWRRRARGRRRRAAERAD